MLRHEVVAEACGTAESRWVMAHDLRRVEALSKRSSIFKLGDQLLASVRGRLRHGQAEGGEVFDFKSLGVVGLGGDGDDLVVLVQVEELEVLREALKGGAGSIDKLLVGTRELQAFGLSLVGDLHGFLGRLHLFDAQFLVNSSDTY